MSQPRTYLVSFSEITLKGKNRSKLQHLLETTLKNKLKEVTIRQLQGRLLLQTPASKDRVEKILKTTFGIANFSACQIIPTSIESITKAVSQQVSLHPGNSFGLKAIRIDKKLAFNSDDINRQVGSAVNIITKKAVNLTKPDILCRIYIDTEESYIAAEPHIGPSGLPTGSSAPLLSLISGGIDSPVASYHMMSRGSRVEVVHFHSYPQTNRYSIEKVKAVCQTLASYQGEIILTLVPILEIQKAMFTAVDHSYLVILYRRAMLRLAEKIARAHKCTGLVTGDSLGQVASQTVENLQNQDHALETIVFRPLIGLDKQTIINTAKHIGTYDISIAPHEDCCSLFVPKHPKTRTKRYFVEKEESKIPEYSQLLDQAIEQTTTETLI